MPDIMSAFANSPFWAWLAVAAILLGLEIIINSQWLVWIAAAAATVALISFLPVPLGLVGQVLLLGVLSALYILVSKRYLKPKADAPDVNDPTRRMVGAQAKVIEGFGATTGERSGRVDFDGVVWPAVQADDADLTEGAMVKIIAVEEGRLRIGSL